MISAEKHVAPSHREATTKACEQANHEELSQNWRHVRTPMLRGSAAQAPRPASLAGKGRQAGACHDARGCIVANWPTRCSGALVKLQSQFRLRLFGVETASPHGQAVQHETGHEVRITINRIVSTPMRTPPRVLTATFEQQNRPAM